MVQAGLRMVTDFHDGLPGHNRQPDTTMQMPKVHGVMPTNGTPVTPCTCEAQAGRSKER